MEALRQIDDWPVPTAVVGVAGPDGVRGVHGDPERVFDWKSVTKLVTALAALVAAEEGVVELDAEAGPPGATVRHLLAHASGLPTDGLVPVARAGERRIYSNSGFELLAETVAARAEMPFAEYLAAGVLGPLGMKAELVGSPAAGIHGSLHDLLALACELLRPTLLAAETLAEATSVAYPGLAGVLPGFGRQDPNDWGLGFELRDGKSPHWTGARNSPQTFGHFGQSGTFLWVDPVAQIACACLTDRDFGDWSRIAWPEISDAVLAAS